MKVIVSVIFWLGSASVTAAQFNQGPFTQCFNPNNKPGFCVRIDECETIMSVAYRQPLTQTDREFIRASECFSGYEQTHHVCCTTDTGFLRQIKFAKTPATTTPLHVTSINPYWESPRTESFFPYNDYGRNERPQWPRFGDPELKQERRQVPLLNTANDASRLPEPPTCGGITIENKIYGGSDADLREFPWMVILEYERRTTKNGNRIARSCSGSLINQRYVLTAAHCVHGTIVKKIGPLVSIRLGEHDLSQKLDCNGYGSCIPEATRIGFEEIITHELYKDSSPNKQYDIALIRLDRNIHFSDSVSPICLPSVLKAKSIGSFVHKPGTQLTAAGWGQTLNSLESPVKQKVNIPLVDHKHCQRKFKNAGVNIVDTQLCAGGKFAEDSCIGDSGGPLMHFRGGVWVLEGIISFGHHCGLIGWPGVHTQVASFDQWIRNKLRP